MSLKLFIGDGIKHSMKKYVCCVANEYGTFKPYAVVECSEETAKKMEKLKHISIQEFIANKLHEKYPNKFPAWLNCFGEKNIFWQNNIIEDYEEACCSLSIDDMQTIIENYINETFIYNSKWKLDVELEYLPKFVI